MAIENNTLQPASKFWPSFLKKRLAFIITTRLIVDAAVVAGLYLIGAPNYNPLLFWITVAIFIVVSLGLSILNLLFDAKPTKDLLAAVITTLGERSTLTPPNPNDEKYANTGLKEALQTIYELSSRKQEEKTAVQPANQLSSVISNSLDITKFGLVAYNSKHQIIYFNKAAPVHADLNGANYLAIIQNENDTIEKWVNSRKNNVVRDERIWVRVPDRLPNEEGRRFFDIVASYQNGLEPEVVLTFIDRTADYIVDEENLDFLSFAAHELRGPITVIRGYLEVLLDELSDNLKDDQKELFRRLEVSSNRLSGYINNILNTSRYDRRHLKVHLAENTIETVYDVIRDDMQMRASSQNRLLAVSFPKNLPTIAVDITSMSEVFGNLIDNAIKYSNEGGAINVTAREANGFVEFIVQDNGIGMPDSVISNLFQKFYRSHRSRETVAGTGIGLYISKAIVESHGGTISVRSEEGKGSVFIVAIPIYATVADKLKAGNNSNESLIQEGRGWIKNHSMYRG